jgi:hypothetical protein
MPAMGGMPLGTGEGVLRNQRMYGATLLWMMRNSSGVRGSRRNAASAVSGEMYTRHGISTRHSSLASQSSAQGLTPSLSLFDALGE